MREKVADREVKLTVNRRKQKRENLQFAGINRKRGGGR